MSTMLREGAQRLVAQAVEAEFADFLARVSGERLADGRAAVVRNGFQPEREILTGLGSVSVRVPKARSRVEAPAVFRSALVPPYVRRAKSVEAVLLWLCLHGVSTGNIQEALAALLGPEAAGLSASAVARLKGCWIRRSIGLGAVQSSAATAGCTCGSTVLTRGCGPRIGACARWWS